MVFVTSIVARKPIDPRKQNKERTNMDCYTRRK